MGCLKILKVGKEHVIVCSGCVEYGIGGNELRALELVHVRILVLLLNRNYFFDGALPSDSNLL